jgi:drug/metabolite transporter (DMT)-like permease
MIGVTAALLSAVCATAKDIVSKKVAPEVSGRVSALASFLFAVPYYLVLLSTLYLLGFETFAVHGAFFTWVILRALSDTAAEWLKMEAIAVSDLSFIACFLALSPVFLIFTSPFLTGDPIGWSEVGALLLVVAGTIIVAWKPGESLARADRRGMLLGTGAAFFFSLNTCFDRLAVQTASPTLSGFAVTLAAGLILLPTVRQTPSVTPDLWRLRHPFLLRGFLELSFMVAKLTALVYLTAPTVMALQRISLVLSVIGGHTLFHERDFRRRLVGATLVLGGVVLLLSGVG